MAAPVSLLLSPFPPDDRRNRGTGLGFGICGLSAMDMGSGQGFAPTGCREKSFWNGTDRIQTGIRLIHCSGTRAVAVSLSCAVPDVEHGDMPVLGLTINEFCPRRVAAKSRPAAWQRRVMNVAVRKREQWCHAECFAVPRSRHQSLYN